MNLELNKGGEKSWRHTDGASNVNLTKQLVKNSIEDITSLKEYTIPDFQSSLHHAASTLRCSESLTSQPL